MSDGFTARRVALFVSGSIAAFKAVARATDQPSIALRIGSYLVVGVFLLAVAYWYRAAGADAAGATDAGTSTIGAPTPRAAPTTPA